MKAARRATLIVIILLGLGVVAVVAYLVSRTPRAPRNVNIPPATSSPTIDQAPPTTMAIPTNWAPRFREVYGLPSGQALKFVAAPLIPERRVFARQIMGEQQYQRYPAGPSILVLYDDGAQFSTMTWRINTPPSVAVILQSVLDFNPWDLRGPPKLMATEVRGDWVVRAGSTWPQRLRPLLDALSQRLGMSGLKLEQHDVPRPAIVVRGSFSPHPLIQPTEQGKVPIVFFLEQTMPARVYPIGHNFADRLARACQMSVVLETKIDDGAIELHNAGSAYVAAHWPDATKQRALAQLLENVAKQTSLELKVDTRTLPTWELSSRP